METATEFGFSVSGHSGQMSLKKEELQAIPACYIVRLGTSRKKFLGNYNFFLDGIRCFAI
ncbi:MAG: hypothetical protein DMG88_23570 [Acidobacteria bacterium]|nr:MAG: hypothetical protein DMG88_23570 [Acidobacteriota bacterium]